LGHTNTLKFYAGLPLNILDEILSLCRVESDADTRGASTSRSTTSVDVGFNLFWRFNLNNQVDVWDVETTRCNISRNQHFELALLKALHSDFTLVLNNVTVHHLDVLLNFIRQNESVCVCLSLCKNDSFSLSTVADQNVSESRQPVLVWTADREMLHLLGSLILQLDSKIDNPSVLLHVVVGDIANP
jgi:hypothetical protein